jgi:hypothetical protein
MDNELIVTKNWWNTNWKWFLPASLLLFLLLLVFFLTSGNGGNITTIAQTYADDSLYQKAIEKANTNKRVLSIIGKIEPLDKLAILEGDAIYSNNNNSVLLSTRIKGSKGKARMDISAKKSGTAWEYKAINIRIKHPKEEIQIIKIP